MAEGSDRAQDRYENLQAIEPLLGALRVMSLSTMQMALNRQQALTRYSDRFREVAAQLTALAARPGKPARLPKTADEPPQPGPAVLAVIGSSRGIIGQYNKRLARMAAERLESRPDTPYTVLAFGSRLQTALRQENVSFEPEEALSSGSLPNYDIAAGFIRAWMAGMAAGTLGAVEVLSFRKGRHAQDYQPGFTHLLPENTAAADAEEPSELDWPAPIIEGDPQVMLERIGDHLTALKFYGLILDAIAAENLYRFRLLEEARENTADLLEELGQAIQMERRKEITQQLQELLAGSGMLGEW